ncbi:MAG: response regulator transcription factor [Chloroflexales bacterium]|nr:response regulator transcription factor [Chloroflexales bacterium]
MARHPIRILIGDDHPIVCDALCTLLANAEQFTVVATARSFPEVVAVARRLPADVVILDLEGMEGSPLAVIQRLQRDVPALKVIVFSSTIDLAPDLLEAGAAGYVAKEELSSVLVAAITAVVAGQTFRSPFVEEYLERSRRETSLTPKEQLALKLLAQGLTTLEIAEYMHIEPRSAQNYITSLLRKTGCAQRLQLVDWYRRKYDPSS